MRERGKVPSVKLYLNTVTVNVLLPPDPTVTQHTLLMLIQQLLKPLTAQLKASSSSRPCYQRCGGIYKHLFDTVFGLNALSQPYLLLLVIHKKVPVSVCSPWTKNRERGSENRAGWMTWKWTVCLHVWVTTLALRWQQETHTQTPTRKSVLHSPCQ